METSEIASKIGISEKRAQKLEQLATEPVAIQQIMESARDRVTEMHVERSRKLRDPELREELLKSAAKQPGRLGRS